MKWTRRQFIALSLAAGALPMETLAMESPSEDPADWLGATRYIDCNSAQVRATAASVTAGLSSPRDRAIALHRFVSQNTRFGFAREFWDNTASEVLRAGIGYCNTKSTLFVAMLRASGIPARQVFVDIHASVLGGILEPGTPYVDHSYVEAFVQDAWRATDAYIVDPAMFGPARRKALAEGRRMGYGVNPSGTTNWDGLSASFSQFDLRTPDAISTKFFGVYRDVGDFYRRNDQAWNRLNSPLRAAMGLLARGANARAQSLRDAT